MNQPTTRRACLGMLGAGALCLGVGARAQAFPSKPIQFIVPYPAGGATDNVARLLADKMSKKLGQNVIVENKAGASGILGTDLTAKAAPDGHT